MITRRRILALTATAFSPLCAFAQSQNRKIPKLGFLFAGTLALRPQAQGFWEAMQELGYFPGKNILVQIREARGNIENLPTLAKELVDWEPDVMVAVTHFAVSAAQRATTTIPIVMVVSANPLERNHVHDLAQPEANITGTVTSFEAVEDKRLQLLQEAIPKVNRVAFLWNNKNIEVPKRLQTLGLPLGLRVIPIPFARPADLVPALHSGLEGKPEALLIQTDPITFDLRSTIITFALENRLPSFFGFTDDARDGGLIAYGVDLRNEYRRGAPYVDKILKGAKPSELPVDQSTQYQLVVNLKTARALGLDVPASIVARADELVE